jgi:RHS repeat-associated protein
MHDEESNLDNFGARPDAFTDTGRSALSESDRYYTSTMGRWMTPDWSARGEAVPYAVLTNPQSLNLYAYVLDNPETSLDPDGHLNGPGHDETPPNGCGGTNQPACQQSSAQVAADQTNNPPAQQQINNLTVGDVAGIVYNETSSLTNSGTQNNSIDTARTDVAHAIINADVKYGDKRDELAGTAPSTVSKAAMGTAAYKSSLAAAEAAYTGYKAGKDPTNGATHFNLRGSPSTANFLKSRTNPGFAIKTHSGPFNNSYPAGGLPRIGVYVNTYE